MDKEILSPFKKLENIVAACNRCGFCTSYCPTYNATGNEGQSPRGRNQAFRALLEGKITDPQETKEIIDTCLLCGECTSVCFSEVPTAQLMVQARYLLNQAGSVPAPLRFIFSQILPHPARLKLLLKILFWGKRWGFSWLLRKTGLLKLISPHMVAADELVPQVPGTFFLERKETLNYQEQAFRTKERDFFIAQKQAGELKQKGQVVPESLVKKLAVKPARAKIAFMPVCGSQYVRPEIGIATLKLFQKLNLDFSIPELICCGLPAASTGMLDHLRAMARENIGRLERARFEAIVTDDSSCTAHLKEIPRYFLEDRAWYDRAHTISSRVREMSSFLVQWGLIEHLKKITWTGGVVAYHDPCKAQYGQNVIQPPRELLAAIKELTLVPIVDSDQCCGGGGTYSFVHADLSQEILSKKIKNIIDSGCRIVVTSSASCLIQLAFGLRAQGSPIQALHLSEFLVRALEKGR